MDLTAICYRGLLELVTPDGFIASDASEAYGCLFGRDGAITSLKAMRTISRRPPSIDSDILLSAVRQTLIRLMETQGRETNIESGEEPGKIVHEYRRDHHERLTAGPTPWYVYPDGTMRNYDSVDSTPLTLIALYRYWRLSLDHAFLASALPAVKRGLEWIMNYADRDGDGLVEFEYLPDRRYGGLRVQSWTDSDESLKSVDGRLPRYPIATPEAQGFTWLALKLWAHFYADVAQPDFGDELWGLALAAFADRMKRQFEISFLFEDSGGWFPAQALDGMKQPTKTVTGNALALLWPSYTTNGTTESILPDALIPSIVQRSFRQDMFDPDAGIRTMSTMSPTFNPGTDSYHNGSFWPMLNGLCYEGLKLWKYDREAELIRSATVSALTHFATPIELYVKKGDGSLSEYRSPSGSPGCRKQAWTAAAALDMLTDRQQDLPAAFA
jgi:glycogen debranching enzyme